MSFVHGEMSLAEKQAAFALFGPEVMFTSVIVMTTDVVDNGSTV